MRASTLPTVDAGSMVHAIDQLVLDRVRGGIEQRLAQLATKAELEIWGGALLARLLERIDSSQQRLLAKLARQTAASAMLCRRIGRLHADGARNAGSALTARPPHFAALSRASGCAPRTDTVRTREV